MRRSSTCRAVQPLVLKIESALALTQELPYRNVRQDAADAAPDGVQQFRAIHPDDAGPLSFGCNDRRQPEITRENAALAKQDLFAVLVRGPSVERDRPLFPGAIDVPRMGRQTPNSPPASPEAAQTPVSGKTSLQPAQGGTRHGLARSTAARAKRDRPVSANTRLSSGQPRRPERRCCSPGAVRWLGTAGPEVRGIVVLRVVVLAGAGSGLSERPGRAGDRAGHGFLPEFGEAFEVGSAEVCEEHLAHDSVVGDL